MYAPFLNCTMALVIVLVFQRTVFCRGDGVCQDVAANSPQCCIPLDGVEVETDPDHATQFVLRSALGSGVKSAKKSRQRRGSFDRGTHKVNACSVSLCGVCGQGCLYHTFARIVDMGFVS